MKRALLALFTLVSISTSAINDIACASISVDQTSWDSTRIKLNITVDFQAQGPPDTVYVERWRDNSTGNYVFYDSVPVFKDFLSIQNGLATVHYVSDYYHLNTINSLYPLAPPTVNWRFIFRGKLPSLANVTTSSAGPWPSFVSVDYKYVQNNSSPRLERPFTMDVHRDTLYTERNICNGAGSFIYDVDNDSLFIEHVILSGVLPNWQSPSNITVSRDSLAFISPSTGRMANEFKVYEYRNDTLIGSINFQWTFNVYQTSGIGLDENQLEKEISHIWDWQGRPVTKQEPGKFYIIRYTDGSFEKVFLAN